MLSVVQVQILNANKCQLKLAKQTQKKHVLHANRGNIFDEETTNL